MKLKASLENKIELILFIIVFIFLTGTIYSEKLMTLPEIYRAGILIVKNGNVYVTDNSDMRLLIYSLDTRSLIKKFGAQGTDRGEFLTNPDLRIYPDFLYVYSADKAVYFSNEGKFKKEFRISLGQIGAFFPVGNSFVALKTDSMIKKKESLLTEISIYKYEDNYLKFKKLLHSFESQKPENLDNKLDYFVIRDCVDVMTYENKIFIGDSKLGLCVLIFDSKGNKIGKVNLPQSEKVKITEQFKMECMESMQKKSSPSEVEIVYSMYNFKFPEFLPSFYKFAVDKGKIYFLTYNEKQNKREIIIADWKGNLLTKAYVSKSDFVLQNKFSIENDKYYYLVDKNGMYLSQYELHVEDIK